MANNSIKAAFERMWQHIVAYVDQHAGGSDVLETVGSDTLTWDGNTEGIYNVLGMSYLVSDVIPTIDELKQGGIFIDNADNVFPFTEADIVDVEAVGAGTGCYVIINDSVPMVLIVYEPNASFTFQYNGQTFTGTSEKTGILFAYNSETSYIKSIIIDGYTGFTKEQIKMEYLPEIDHGYTESVDSDTLTWDGNREGKVSVAHGSFGENSAFYYVSDATPTAEELSKGGSIVFGTDTVLFDSTAVMDGNFIDAISFPGIILLAPGYRMDWLFAVLIVSQDNLTVNSGDDVYVIKKKGTYFIYRPSNGYYDTRYIKSLTINDYNGFTKEVINDELLPKHEWSALGGDLSYKDKLIWDGKPTKIAATSHGSTYLNSDAIGDITWFKLSDATPSLNEIQSAIVTVKDGDSETTVELDSSQISMGTNVYCNIGKYAKVLYVDNSNIANNNAAEAGTYLAMHAYDNSVFVSSLYIPGYEWRDSINKIPNEYLDIVDTVDGVATAIILASPNGTRFSITVGDDGVLSATEITE